MSEFFKNKGRLAGAIAILFVAVVALAGSIAWLIGGEDALPFLQKTDSSEEAAEEGGMLEGEGLQALTAGVEFDPDADILDVGTEEEPDDTPPTYNMPTELRGVYLVPGTDFLTGGASTEDAVRAQVSTALANAKNLTMNTVIIDTVYGEKLIYKTSGATRAADFDVMQLVVDEARAQNFYVFAIFDLSRHADSGRTGTTLAAAGAGQISRAAGELRDFAQTYNLDAILIDGYENEAEADSYVQYLSLGGGIGFDNYMKQSPQALVQTASDTVRKYARNTQVGLLAEAVWENADNDETGSNTRAAHTALGTANADTRAFVEEGLVDFVAVRAFASTTDTAEPFEEVVSWWSDVVREQGIPLYMIHASNKACTDNPGWESRDQLARQVIEASGYTGYRGSIFNDLSRLVEDPNEATTTLVKYFSDETQAAFILTELEITKPDQTTFTTFEPIVTFTGASDPNAPVTINDEEIPTDASGYFTVTYDLDAGVNSYVIEHKEKTLRYSITREVQILKEVSPTGSITTEGGMSIMVTALAYQDAQVSASFNGQTIGLTLDDSVEDEQDRDSNYKLFVGEFVMPAATDSEQNLGSIVVSASWEGMSDSMTGASVRVNKRAQVEDGVPVVVTASQARTYPPDTLNNIPSPSYYPLPAGAMDYAVGDEITYVTAEGKTYNYFVLASGLRVLSDDISASSDYAAGNVISGITVRADASYTYVILRTAQKVSYNFKYAPEGITVTFNYTTQVPDNLRLNQNPLFTAATWEGSTLHLPFVQRSGFMGYRGYFNEDGNLVLRFNNPPSSISRARIAIDPGHGGYDTGATGFLANYPERVINLAIAQKLAAELQSRGATVLLIDTSMGMSLAERVRQAENFNAQLFVSIHNNSAARASAVGTESYYFYPYSYALAHATSNLVSSSLDSTNRGPRNSYYTVTLSSQFASALVECGFLTNKDEYEKLINASYQQRIANGLADAIASAIASVYPGSSELGEQSAGASVSVGTEQGGFTPSNHDDDDFGDDDSGQSHDSGGEPGLNFDFD